MAREEIRTGDQFPTITLSVSKPDTVVSEHWVCVIPLDGLEFDGRPGKVPASFTVIGFNFGGASGAPSGVRAHLIGNTTLTDNVRSTVSLRMEVDAGVGAFADIPIILQCCPIRTDSPAIDDLVFPPITPDTTDWEVLDAASGTVGCQWVRLAENAVLSTNIAEVHHVEIPGSIWPSFTGDSVADGFSLVTEAEVGQLGRYDLLNTGAAPVDVPLFVQRTLPSTFKQWAANGVTVDAMTLTGDVVVVKVFRNASLTEIGSDTRNTEALTFVQVGLDGDTLNGETWVPGDILTVQVVSTVAVSGNVKIGPLRLNYMG